MSGTSEVASEQLAERVERLFAIGRRTGADRPGFSRAEQAALELAASWMAEAGLAVAWDAIGNLYGTAPAAADARYELWTGSHLDTVPDGGRYDGPLGVLAGIAAAGRLRGRLPPGVRLRVVAFRDEEGTRFGNGCLGSRAVAGAVPADELDRVDADGIALGDALAALGLALPAAPWPIARPDAFVEAHLEQGAVLAERGLAVGVASAITGMRILRVVLDGRAGHAGTTPMAGRRDALVAAARLVHDVRERARATAGVVATVGTLAVAPGAANVIPARAELTVDCRSIDDAALAAFASATAAAAAALAAEEGCACAVATVYASAAHALDDAVGAALGAAAEGCGVTRHVLAAGATHDAAVLAAAGVASGMLLVRTGNEGRSHVPDEHVDDADLALAVDVLAEALLRVAREAAGGEDIDEERS